MLAFRYYLMIPLSWNFWTGRSLIVSRLPRAFRSSCIDFSVVVITHRLYSSSSAKQDEITAPSTSQNDKDINNENDDWMTEGLLISSWSDGVVPNVNAQRLIHRGLLRSMLRERLMKLEQQLRDSVQNSPCNGPNIQVWQQMEEIDQLLALQQPQKRDPNFEQWIASANAILAKTIDETEQKPSIVLRFVYIPTAMYALRLDSSNTPGKQRQRARADAKKRRNEIVQTVQSILGSSFAIASVTVDLDDGSVKHAELSSSSDNENGISTSTASHSKQIFPKSGREALIDWQPHFLYIQGGNTFWLYHCMEKGGWIQELKHLVCIHRNQQQPSNTTCSPPFFCGNSAGAIVAGASLETATWKEWDDPRVVPGRERYEDWCDRVNGLTLVGPNVSFFPHYEDGAWQDTVQQRTIDLQQRHPGMQVCCLRDDQVCYVDGSTRTRIVLPKQS